MSSNTNNRVSIVGSTVIGLVAAGAALVVGGLVATGTTTSFYRYWMRRGKKKNKDDDDTDDNDLIYLDYNGTTPVYKDVLDAMLPFFRREYGNPSSSHAAGDKPQQAVDEARQIILQDLLGFAADDPPTPLSNLLFTSCGTESDNLAIHLSLLKYCGDNNKDNDKLPHIVTTNIEHPAIENYLKVLEAENKCVVTYVPVQKKDGRVMATDIIQAIKSNTILVTIMLANNETGALQPVADVAKYCRQHNILCHTDAAQAAGKVSVSVVDDLGDIDMVSIVGHKLGAPKGIACLYVRDGCLGDINNKKRGLLIGGGQEFGWRGGTENVPYMVGMAHAASMAGKHLSKNRLHMERLRHRLSTRLKDGLGEDTVMIHGPTDPEHRLPNTLSIGFGGNIHSTKLLDALRDQVAASAGATCHSGASHVLRAMQVPDEFAQSTIRLSLGPKTTATEIDTASALLISEVKRQRRQVPGFQREL